MPQVAKNPMMTPVHLTVKQNITSLPASSTSNGNIQENAVHHKEKLKLVTGLCPVQKVGVMSGNGEFVEVLAMLDSGSNTSLLSKNAARRLGLSGSATHLTMNLAGGKKKSEASQIIDITVA